MIKFLESWKIILKSANTKKNRIRFCIMSEREVVADVTAITFFCCRGLIFSCFSGAKVVSLKYESGFLYPYGYIEKGGGAIWRM